MKAKSHKHVHSVNLVCCYSSTLHYLDPKISVFESIRKIQCGLKAKLPQARRNLDVSLKYYWWHLVFSFQLITTPNTQYFLPGFSPACPGLEERNKILRQVNTISYSYLIEKTLVMIESTNVARRIS